MFKRSFLIIVSAVMPAVMFAQVSGYRATYFVDGNEEKDQYRSHVSLESYESGSSAVYATNGVHLVLTRMRLNKTSGTVNDADRRETGKNSVVLADGGSNVIMEFCEVNSHAQAADGVSASGEGTKVTLQEGSISTSRVGAAAVNATNKSKVIVQKTTVNTYSNQSPAFYACKDGTMEIAEAKGDNTGQAASSFYVSTGSIKAEKCELSSAKWTIGSLDEGLLELTGNKLKAGGVCGFLVYGADGKQREWRSTGTLVLDKNEITVTEGPLIFVTNAGGTIFLSRNKIICKNDEIISIKADEWGPKGYNQGDATIDLEKQTLNGDIYVDSISSLTLTLKNSAKLNGSITGGATDRRAVKVFMKKGAKWNLKGECYISSISFEQPLEKGLKQLKGKHIIYYDPAANADLGGKEYKTGGGVLRPMK